MENLSLVNEIAKSVGDEIGKSFSPADIVTAVFGKGGIFPIIGKEFWIGSYYVSIDLKK